MTNCSCTIKHKHFIFRFLVIYISTPDIKYYQNNGLSFITSLYTKGRLLQSVNSTGHLIIWIIFSIVNNIA